MTDQPEKFCRCKLTTIVRREAGRWICTYCDLPKPVKTGRN